MGNIQGMLYYQKTANLTVGKCVSFSPYYIPSLLLYGSMWRSAVKECETLFFHLLYFGHGDYSSRICKWFIRSNHLKLAQRFNEIDYMEFFLSFFITSVLKRMLSSQSPCKTVFYLHSCLI